MIAISPPVVFLYKESGSFKTADADGRTFDIQGLEVPPQLRLTVKRFKESFGKHDCGVVTSDGRTELATYETLHAQCYALAKEINPNVEKTICDKKTLGNAVSCLKGFSLKKVLSTLRKKSEGVEKYGKALLFAAVLTCSSMGVAPQVQADASYPLKEVAATQQMAASQMGVQVNKIYSTSIRALSAFMSEDINLDTTADDIRVKFDYSYFSKEYRDGGDTLKWKNAMWEHGLAYVSAKDLLVQSKEKIGAKGIEFSSMEKKMLESLKTPSKNFMAEVFAPDLNGGSPVLPVWLLEKISIQYMEGQLGHSITDKDVKNFAKNGDNLHKIISFMADKKIPAIQKNALVREFKANVRLTPEEGGSEIGYKDITHKLVQPCVLDAKTVPTPEQVGQSLRDASALLGRPISKGEVQLFLETLAIESGFGKERSYENARGTIQILKSSYTKLQPVIESNPVYSNAVAEAYDASLSSEENLINNITLNTVLYFIYSDYHGNLGKLGSKLTSVEKRWDFYHNVHNNPPADRPEIGVPKARFINAVAEADSYLKRMTKEGFSVASLDGSPLGVEKSIKSLADNEPHNQLQGQVQERTQEDYMYLVADR